MSGRIERRFAALKAEGRGGLVTFFTGGDPDLPTFREILFGAPAAGADVIEIGVPFTDPAADGPSIQAAGQRALARRIKVRDLLATVREFRARDADTPVVLMGYYNPILRFGPEAFAKACAEAGVDGLITVDLPPEEEAELRGPAAAAGVDIVRLVAPTTGDDRMSFALKDASGFVYFVSIAGITGTRAAAIDTVEAAVARIRRVKNLPIAVGFGIRTPGQAAAVARVADAAVVGTALVEKVAENLDETGTPRPGTADAVLSLVSELAQGVRAARRPA